MLYRFFHPKSLNSGVYLHVHTSQFRQTCFKHTRVQVASGYCVGQCRYKEFSVQVNAYSVQSKLRLLRNSNTMKGKILINSLTG